MERLESDLLQMADTLNSALAEAKEGFCTSEDRRCRVRICHTAHCSRNAAALAAKIRAVGAQFNAARDRVAAEAPSYASRLLGGITAKRASKALAALVTAVKPAEVEWPCTRFEDLDVEFEAAVAHLYVVLVCFFGRCFTLAREISTAFFCFCFLRLLKVVTLAHTHTLSLLLFLLLYLSVYHTHARALTRSRMF